MRMPKYLSPSSLAKWEGNPEEFFIQYIVPKNVRPDKPPQLDVMAVGSAFDALVKNKLYVEFFGYDQAVADGYSLTNLVKNQCEPHTLPKSFAVASGVFDQYIESGAYGLLLEDIKASPVPPRMEIDVQTTVAGVPLLGKPDLIFESFSGCLVIADWKVSGSLSKRGVSPQQGYMRAMTVKEPGEIVSHKKFEGWSHPCAEIICNKVPMNETTDYWADQLATYAWALGHPVGSEDFVVIIEQLACRPPGKRSTDGELNIKCCQHRSYVSQDHQLELMERYKKCWSHIESGHYFPDMTKQESDHQANLIVKGLTTPVTSGTLATGTLDLPWEK